MNENYVGKSLQAHRQALGMSINGVNEQTGISIAALSKYEVGALHPTDEHLATLASLFKVSVDKLANGELPPAPAIPSNPAPSPHKVRRPRQGRRSWLEEDPILLNLVLTELKSGGTVGNSFRRFAELTGRSASSVSVRYFSEIRPKHLEELQRAREQGKVSNENSSRVFGNPSDSKSDETNHEDAGSPEVGSFEFVVWSMLKMTAQERKQVQEWVSNQYPVLSESDLGIARTTKVSITLSS